MEYSNEDDEPLTKKIKITKIKKTRCNPICRKKYLIKILLPPNAGSALIPIVIKITGSKTIEVSLIA